MILNMEAMNVKYFKMFLMIFVKLNPNGIINILHANEKIC